MKARALLFAALCSLLAVSSAIAAPPTENAEAPEVVPPNLTAPTGAAEVPSGDIITSPVLEIIAGSSPEAVSCVTCTDFVVDYYCYKYCLGIGAGPGGACTFGCCECL